MRGKEITLIIGIVLTVVCIISTVICFIVPEEQELLPMLATAGSAMALVLNSIIMWKKK